jgi:hypothetical protein
MDSKHLGVLLHPNCVTAMLRGLITQAQIIRLNDQPLARTFPPTTFLGSMLRGPFCPPATATEYGLLRVLQHMSRPFTDASVDFLLNTKEGSLVKLHVRMLVVLKERNMVEQDYTVERMATQENKQQQRQWLLTMQAEGLLNNE